MLEQHLCAARFRTFTVSGLAREANYNSLLATKIALKWEKPLSEGTGWVRATLAFAILRATCKSVHKRTEAE